MVLKGCSADLAHKSEAEAVKLNAATGAEVASDSRASAFEEIDVNPLLPKENGTPVAADAAIWITQ